MHKLGFCVLMHSDPVLSDATDQLGTPGLKRAMKVLSVLLGLTPAEVEAGVGAESSLIRAGLLAIGTGHRVSLALSSLLYTSNTNLPGLLRYSQGIPLEMFSYEFRLSPPGNLSHEHYSHVKGPLNTAQRYLSKALRQGWVIVLT